MKGRGLNNKSQMLNRREYFGEDDDIKVEDFVFKQQSPDQDPRLGHHPNGFSQAAQKAGANNTGNFNQLVNQQISDSTPQFNFKTKPK